MRSLNLRRVAVAAALAFANWFCVSFDPWAQTEWPWLLRAVANAWIACGADVAPPLTLLALIAFGARMVARQHVLAGGADPLERVRRWVAERRSISRVFYGGVALRTASVLFLERDHYRLPEEAAFLCGGVALPALAVVLTLRAFGRAVLAPLVHPSELERKDADGYLFSAVAVTAESRAAVGLLAALTVGVVAFLASTSSIFRPTGLAVAFGYGALATLMAYSFKTTSRIAIGLDGVRVSGSSRPRFYAYRDLDGVDVARGGDVVLLRRGRAALRLQLHGADAARRGPVGERLREAIARAHAPEAVAQRLAETATPAVLAQAARGDGDYRSPAASRDALWEVVEAPAATGETRARAARALAAGAGRADRARLRIAADRCAEPKARQALARIAVGEEEDEEEARAPLLRAHEVPGPPA